MEKLQDAVANYQTKIGSYDKQLWEKSVEQKILLRSTLRHLPKKNVVQHNTDLIDVDLIRGTAFTKSKPEVPWSYIARKAVLRLIFLPLYSRWWIQQTSFHFWLFLLIIYSLQSCTLIVFVLFPTDKAEDSLSHTLVPVIMMVILAVIHSQTILCHISHKAPSISKKYGHRGKKKKKRPQPSKSKPPIPTADTNESENKLKCEDSLRSKRKLDSPKKAAMNDYPSKHITEIKTEENCSNESRHISFKDSTTSIVKFGPIAVSSDLSDRDESSLENSLDTSVVVGDNQSPSNRTYIDGDLKCHSGNDNCDIIIQSNHYVSDTRTDEEKLHRDIQSSNLISNIGISSSDDTLKTSTSRDSAEHPSMDCDINNIDMTSSDTADVPKVSVHGSNNDSVSKFSPSNLSSPHSNPKTELSDLSFTSQKKEIDNSSNDDSSFGLRRRKRVNSNSDSRDRERPIPKELEMKESTGVSSSEGDTAPNTPSSHKNNLNSEDWEDRMQSDLSTSSSYSTSGSEISDIEADCSPFDDSQSTNGGTHMTTSNMHIFNLLNPSSSGNISTSHSKPDKISCLIWERNECQKVDLTALDIGWAIIDKVDHIPESADYILIGIAFTIVMTFVPIAFHTFHLTKDIPMFTLEGLWQIWLLLSKNSFVINIILLNGMIQRLCLSAIFFFLLSVAERTFKQRLLYAKHFCYLTSSRRSRKFEMPHFRLNKVRNIKTWLSLRSYLKRRGPQRSVDVILSSAFLLAIICVILLCLQLLKDAETYLDSLYNWELLVWCLALGVYLLRFMTLGLKINKKYRNLSVLITEQINLYLQMEQKPHKKEELMLSNNVLKLAEDLIKELESPFKISGMSANPFVYNVMKVIVLSAFSGVLSELLGFKLKLFKIKLKA